MTSVINAIISSVAIGLVILPLCFGGDEAEGLESFRKEGMHSCKNSHFCKRLRYNTPDASKMLGRRALSVEKIYPHGIIEGKIRNPETAEEYNITVQCLEKSIIRVTINEIEVHRKRYQPNPALKRELNPGTWSVAYATEEDMLLQSATYSLKIFFYTAQLQLFLSGNNDTEPVVVVNDMRKFVIEGSKPKTRKSVEEASPSRPLYGPMGVSLDFTFPQASNLYGLSQHFDTFSLRPTRYHGEPYHLYNVDANNVLERTHAMHGSVPYVIAHGVNGTVGVFWFNSADTWVDIGTTLSRKYNTHFISETGLIDVFLLPGPTFQDVVLKYVTLTGTAPLPPYSSLGYHLTGLDYDEEPKITAVSNLFAYEWIPLDVLWLSRGITNNSRFFTWDKNKFSGDKLEASLRRFYRKVGIIIDPQMKRDFWDPAYMIGLEKKYFIERPNGRVYLGNDSTHQCAYWDFLKPAVTNYYKSLFLDDNFVNMSGPDLYIWTEENQPIDVNTPDKIIEKDARHFDDWEHRDIHNLYGLLQVQSTYEALLQRSRNRRRPFILTGSYFAGIQRYAAITTGKHELMNSEYLKKSLSACLTAAISGISFCGVEMVTHQFNSELLLRLYQLSAFLPLFRANSEMFGLQMEMFELTDIELKVKILEAFRHRYMLLPYWYTLFYEHTKTGLPVIRPLVMDSPKDVNVFDIADEYLIGSALLVKPILEERAATKHDNVSVYFPGRSLWYHYKRPELETKPKIGKEYFPLEDEILVFVRGGTIIPRCSYSQTNNARDISKYDISLLVAPDIEGKATGRMYLDDGISFDYEAKESYSYVEFSYDNGMLELNSLETNDLYSAKRPITQIHILNSFPIGMNSVHLRIDDTYASRLDFQIQKSSWTIYPERGDVTLGKLWQIFVAH